MPSENNQLSPALPEKHKNGETVELLVAALAHNCVDDLNGGLSANRRDSITKELRSLAFVAENTLSVVRIATEEA